MKQIADKYWSLLVGYVRAQAGEWTPTSKVVRGAKRLFIGSKRKKDIILDENVQSRLQLGKAFSCQGVQLGLLVPQAMPTCWALWGHPTVQPAAWLCLLNFHFFFFFWSLSNHCPNNKQNSQLPAELDISQWLFCLWFSAWQLSLTSRHNMLTSISEVVLYLFQPVKWILFIQLEIIIVCLFCLVNLESILNFPVYYFILLNKKQERNFYIDILIFSCCFSAAEH